MAIELFIGDKYYNRGGWTHYYPTSGNELSLQLNQHIIYDQLHEYSRIRNGPNVREHWRTKWPLQYHDVLQISRNKYQCYLYLSDVFPRELPFGYMSYVSPATRINKVITSRCISRTVTVTTIDTSTTTMLRYIIIYYDRTKLLKI